MRWTYNRQVMSRNTSFFLNTSLPWDITFITGINWLNKQNRVIGLLEWSLSGLHNITPPLINYPNAIFVDCWYLLSYLIWVIYRRLHILASANHSRPISRIVCLSYFNTMCPEVNGGHERDTVPKAFSWRKCANVNHISIFFLSVELTMYKHWSWKLLGTE